MDIDNNGYISILEMIEFLESVCDEITESQVQRLFRENLKVHKNENFFGFDFEFCTTVFQCKLYINNKILVTIMWGAIYLLIDFPKFDPLTAVEMALCVNLGQKCQNLFPLVSD